MRNTRFNMIFNAEIVTWLLPVCVVGNFIRGIALKLWRWYGKVFGAPLWDHCLKAVCSLWNVSSLTQPSYFIGSVHSVATIHQGAFGVDTVATIHFEVRFGSSKLSWEMIEQVSLACSEHWPGLGNAEKKMKLLKWKLFRERNDKSQKLLFSFLLRVSGKPHLKCFDHGKAVVKKCLKMPGKAQHQGWPSDWQWPSREKSNMAAKN